MDVDATEAAKIDAAHTNNLTNQQKATLMQENKCFYCKKVGHRAKDCYKKQCDRGRPPSSSLVNAATTPSDSIYTLPFDLQQFGEGLKKHGPNLDDDAKLDLIDFLLPKDFVQGPN